MLEFPNPSGRDWRREATQPAERKRRHTPPVEPLEDLEQRPPEDETEYVFMERTIRKRVPYWEALVLERHGWTQVPDE